MSRKIKLLIGGAVLVVLAISSVVIVNMIPIKEYGLYEVKYGRDGIAREPRTNKPITGIVKTEGYATGNRKYIKRTEEYKKGKKNGYEKGYCDNGQLSDISYFKDGYIHGEVKFYWCDTGNLKETKTFVYGKLDGVLTQYEPDGHTIHRRKLYNLGQFVEYCNKGDCPK